jgi:RNA-directed DNA polymerase
MQTSLRGIANKATTDKTHRFRNLFGLLTVGFLEWCWQFVNLRAAPGIDRVTARKSRSESAGQHPGTGRDGQSGTVSGQVGAQKIYPQARWKMETAGVPAIADKLLQTAVAKILEAIYEADFLPGSYGYRPGIGALDAVRELSRALEQGLYHYVVEADIQGFFDHAC